MGLLFSLYRQELVEWPAWSSTLWESWAGTSRMGKKRQSRESNRVTGKLAKEDEDLTNDTGLAEIQTMRREYLGRYDFMHYISDKILEALWTNSCTEIRLC